MKKIVVNKKYNNKKLINCLLGEFPNLKTNTIYKALRKKDIIINEKRINDNVIVRTGDLVTIYITDEQLYGNFSLDIIYEDANILIINKPSGIPVTNATKRRTNSNSISSKLL